ncbi:MAG: sulfatase-like hydrolase/transferase [Phycisphaera sp.]|nr:sulfatase-like hydrolase/transferase [Phycisphaera sp.]
MMRHQEDPFMKRSLYVLAGLMQLVSLLLFSKFVCTAQAARPNIVFVLADDLGYGDLGCTGSEFAKTPNLDAFAKQSHVFNNAYAPAPQCSPTRAAILTGEYPARLHITTWIGGEKPEEYKGLQMPEQRKSLPDDAYTLAQYLKSSGYETIQIGKWHVGDNPAAPAKFGFDHTIGFAKGAGPGKPEAWFSPYPNIKDLKGPPGEFITERLTTEAVKFIASKREKPFFMMFQHYNVHAPVVAPPGDVLRYVDEGRPKDKGKLNATYLAAVEQVDKSFGQLVAALKKTGQFDNTIIVFFSDNGANTWDGSNAPYRGGKKEFYEGGIHMPLMMRIPDGLKERRDHDQPVSGIDFFPTFVELTGGSLRDVKAPIDGVSLLPVLMKNEPLKRDCLFWHHPALSRTFKEIPPQGVVREGPWKLIDFYSPSDRDELYNLDEDPGEKNDLAEKYPERVEQMRAKLQAHLKAVGAQMVVDTKGSSHRHPPD